VSVPNRKRTSPIVPLKLSGEYGGVPPLPLLYVPMRSLWAELNVVALVNPEEMIEVPFW
jgi:hypothetical protein